MDVYIWRAVMGSQGLERTAMAVEKHRHRCVFPEPTKAIRAQEPATTFTARNYAVC